MKPGTYMPLDMRMAVPVDIRLMMRSKFLCFKSPLGVYSLTGWHDPFVISSTQLPGQTGDSSHSRVRINHFCAAAPFTSTAVSSHCYKSGNRLHQRLASSR